MKGLTKEELRELEAFDRECEDAPLTKEEYDLARAIDRSIEREHMTDRQRKKRDGYKVYYEREKEKILAKNREYYRANADAIREYQAAYRAKNAAEIAAYKRDRRDPEAVREYNRQYYQRNKARLDAKNRAYAIAHREEIRVKKRSYPSSSPEARRKYAEKAKQAMSNMTGG